MLLSGSDDQPRELSRRDFLATSGSVSWARPWCAEFRVAGGFQLDDNLLYVGTYTEGGKSDGIYLIRMDRRSGKLRQVGSVDAARTRRFSPSTQPPSSLRRE